MNESRGSKESAINGKSRDSAQEETIVVSATMEANVAKQHNRPLPHQNRRHLQKGTLSEAVVLLERDIKDREKTTSVARHVTFGVLPNVNITKHHRDAKLVKSAS